DARSRCTHASTPSPTTTTASNVTWIGDQFRVTIVRTVPSRARCPLRGTTQWDGRRVHCAADSMPSRAGRPGRTFASPWPAAPPGADLRPIGAAPPVLWVVSRSVTNPYDGNEPYQTAWQQGDDYGKSNPND